MRMKDIYKFKFDEIIKSNDNFREDFLCLIADGNSPYDICRNMYGVPWWVLRKWIESSADLMQDYEFARKAGADKLMYDALDEVKKADIETVQLAKLRADRYDRMAGKMDRNTWGDKVEVSVEHTINIVEVLNEAKGRLIDMDKGEQHAIEERQITEDYKQ